MSEVWSGPLDRKIFTEALPDFRERFRKDKELQKRLFCEAREGHKLVRVLLRQAFALKVWTKEELLAENKRRGLI